MKREAKGLDLSAKGRPLVRFDVRHENGRIRLQVQRDNRREAKSDRAYELTTSEARELMRALQAGADRADQAAYRSARGAAKSPIESLEEVVTELAAKLEA